MDGVILVKLIGIVLVFVGALSTEIKWGDRFDKPVRIFKVLLLIVGVGMAFLGEFLQRDKEKKDSDNREAEYITIISRADSNLHVSDSILTKSNQSIDKLEGIQNTASSLNDSMKNELSYQRAIIKTSRELSAKSEEMLNGQQEVLQKNIQLLSKQNELLNISLMGKFIVPKIRVVFSYKNPIVKEFIKGPKFPTTEFLRSQGYIDYGRGFGEVNLFPNYLKLGNGRSPGVLRLRLFVEGFVDQQYGTTVIGEPSIITTPYVENGRYCIAFQFLPSVKMNLAQFYNQIKKANSEILLQKNYNDTVSKTTVIANEVKFMSQDVEVYLEAPLDSETNTWFRINLTQKKNYELKKESYYYSVKYQWEVEQSSESLLIYNE